MFLAVSGAGRVGSTFSKVLVSLFSVFFLVNSLQANPVCGDGITTAPEQCDDGNTVSGDGCSDTCIIEPDCGNGIAEPGEQCDLGLPVNGTVCSGCNLVTPALCGNGNTESAEDCDPVARPTTCNSDCTFSRCGDRKIGPNEECDGGGETATCNTNCKISRCGDGILNQASGEHCDPGLVTAQCNWNCRFNICGDMIVNQLAGEECDPPGNMTDGNTCSPQCKIILATTTAPAGGGALDTGTIIGIAIGAASLAAAVIPLALVFRKWRKTHSFCGLGPTEAVAVGAAGAANPMFQQQATPTGAPTKPLPTLPNGGV